MTSFIHIANADIVPGSHKFNFCFFFFFSLFLIFPFLFFFGKSTWALIAGEIIHWYIYERNWQLQKNSKPWLKIETVQKEKKARGGGEGTEWGCKQVFLCLCLIVTRAHVKLVHFFFFSTTQSYTHPPSVALKVFFFPILFLFL